MFNNVEQKTIEILKKRYGSTHDAVESMERELGLVNANEYIEVAFELFKEKPSCSNYNNMITIMLVYQYWTNKKIKEFILTEDF
tara:strand:- start:143 stop:394 length:252 start_codon:yes stop_codon:yes gene_type:complete